MKGDTTDEEKEKTPSIANCVGTTQTDLDGRRENKIRSCGGGICGGSSSGGGGGTSLSPDQVLEIVLENVLVFLTSRHDRNSASLVCKSWCRAEALTRSDIFIGNCYAISPQRVVQRFRNVRSVCLKGKPRFADFDLVPLDWGAYVKPWVNEFNEAFPCLERLCFKRMIVTDDDLGIISVAFPSFKELVLVSCEGFGVTGLSYIAENCSHLRVLDISDCELEDDPVDWISCFPETLTCLESLVFDCVLTPNNFEALEQLVARSPSLRKLRLNGYIKVAQLLRLMLRAPQLRDLGTGSVNINHVFVNPPHPLEPPPEQVPLEDLAAAFAACQNLTCLSGFKEIVPDYLPTIYPVCANLTSANFSFVIVHTEQFKSVIQHCHKLQVLWVLDSVADEGLQAVAESCKDLRELRVFPYDVREGSDCQVSEVGIYAISEGCRKLQSILFFCQRMTNAAVIAMSRNCPDLVVFRLCIMGLHQPDHLTNEPMDEGFGAIVMNCKKLTRLAVSGLLTDKAFKYIGEHGKLVRTLSVAFSADSDMALTYVLNGCPHLKKLEIRDSPFGDKALLSGLHHYYNMRFVWMSSCKLTLGACKELARRLPHLMVEVISDENEVQMISDENQPSASSSLVEIQRDKEEDVSCPVEKLYFYRSLQGPRNDAPRYVSIL